MEISLISDALTLIVSTKGSTFGISKLNFSSNSSSEQSAGLLPVSAMLFPLDAVAPPPAKSNRVRTLPRRQMKKRRRTRRRSLAGDDDNDEGEEVFGFFGDGGDFNWPFNNGGGGGSWNFGGFEGANWDEFWSNNNNSYNDPAFDFVYEVLSWLVLSNCLHFAFKKVVRIVADGYGDPAREKVPMRLAPVC